MSGGPRDTRIGIGVEVPPELSGATSRVPTRIGQEVPTGTATRLPTRALPWILPDIALVEGRRRTRTWGAVAAVGSAQAIQEGVPTYLQELYSRGEVIGVSGERKDDERVSACLAFALQYPSLEATALILGVNFSLKLVEKEDAEVRQTRSNGAGEAIRVAGRNLAGMLQRQFSFSIGVLAVVHETKGTKPPGYSYYIPERQEYRIGRQVWDVILRIPYRTGGVIRRRR